MSKVFTEEVVEQGVALVTELVTEVAYKQGFDAGLAEAAEIADWLASRNSGPEQYMAERIAYQIRSHIGQSKEK